MARKGRPRKAGDRNKSGRLKALEMVKCSAQAKRRKDLYGQDGWDALGRAYVMGLLGEGEEAKDRLKAGRRYASLYRRFYARGYRCALNDSPRGSDLIETTPEMIAFAVQDRADLDRDTAIVVALGVSPYFDQLVDQHNLHSDMGPSWLDTLLEDEIANRARDACNRARVPSDERDWIVLKAALLGLDAILPKATRRGIVSLSTRAA
jgi:hypothetical protein